MPALPLLAMICILALAVLWVVGEATDKPWLRRLAAPLLVVAVGAAAAGVTAVSTSFDASLRYSGAMKRFVSAVIETAQREGDAAAVDQLRRFDQVSIETYEGGALLEWLDEPLAEPADSDDE